MSNIFFLLVGIELSIQDLQYLYTLRTNHLY